MFISLYGLGDHSGDQTADRLNCTRRNSSSPSGWCGLYSRNSILCMEEIEVSSCCVAPLCAGRQHLSFFCCFILCHTDDRIKAVIEVHFLKGSPSWLHSWNVIFQNDWNVFFVLCPGLVPQWGRNVNGKLLFYYDYLLNNC